MMGYPCVRLAGKFLASFDDKAGRSLVVKLPRERVAEAGGERDRGGLRPAGKVFREWVSAASNRPRALEDAAGRSN